MMANRIKRRYNRIAAIYDVMEVPMEKMFGPWRRRLMQECRGETLEVGVGTGKNIPYYPEEVNLTGIDFSERMISRARRKHGNRPRTTLLVMDAQQMAFADNTFDTVVTSCVFCSVPDPVQGLREIRRVCRPGGRILMLEHVRSERKLIGPLMDVANPVPVNLIGANINRRTYDNLLKAGFASGDIRVQDLWMDILKIFRINNNK